MTDVKQELAQACFIPHWIMNKLMEVLNNYTRIVVIPTTSVDCKGVHILALYTPAVARPSILLFENNYQFPYKLKYWTSFPNKDATSVSVSTLKSYRGNQGGGYRIEWCMHTWTYTFVVLLSEHTPLLLLHIAKSILLILQLPSCMVIILYNLIYKNSNMQLGQATEHTG